MCGHISVCEAYSINFYGTVKKSHLIFIFWL